MKIETKNIVKSFGEKTVLKGISISVESGKALGLLGRNGAGKTTTIRILMDVFKQNSGEVLLDGKPIDRSKIKIGYLPEERGLYSKKTILDQLVYFALLKGLSKLQAKNSAEYWLDKLQMSDYKVKKLETLSKGNQQKIQLAAALISNPDIVILDEPFSGLDPVNASLLKDIVKNLIADNKIVLFSSHQMSYVEEFCDNIAILNNGEIVLNGNIREIKRSYDRSKIEVSSLDVHKIESFAKNSLSDIVDITSTNGHIVTLKLKSLENKNLLISKLAEQDFDIDNIKVFEPSLNDIFVEYTEDRV